VNENPVLLVAHSAIFGGHEDRALLIIGWRFWQECLSASRDANNSA
jgi:hypothetical protein